MQGGSTDEALEDMIGVSVENCFIDHKMTDAVAFAQTLSTLCLSHCVVGIKIDLEMFAAKGNGLKDGDREKLYSKAKT